MQIDFTKKLLKWNREKNKRTMPWKGETDPYRIWLSEIILQQTRVEQGLAYYNKFISQFPTIRDLAGAPEKKIFKSWEGLGYYSRCRNLIATAKKIAQDHKGKFPSGYDEILSLPGVGPYTAAAIASFAFGLPYAVVDGNVERVLSRYFGIRAGKGTSHEKKLYRALAGELLDKKQPGIFNQAIMDFGATVCKPEYPVCTACVLSENCEARKKGWTSLLPIKKSRPERKIRWLYYFIIPAAKNKIWIRERTGSDIWQNLFEFVLLESGKLIPHQKLEKTTFFRERFGKDGYQIKYISPSYRQSLTHQTIVGQFIHIDKPLRRVEGYQSAELSKLSEYPFPKLIASYLKSHPFR